MDVDDLIRLAPPPRELISRVNPDRWEGVEQDLGLELPGDYKLICTVYGVGEFNDLFHIFNPLAEGEGMNLLKQAQRQVTDYDSNLGCYEQWMAVFPEACPFGVFPEPGGLLPLGGDSNGGSAFWLTKGEPDGWSLIYYPHAFNFFEQYSMPLVEFLVRWLSGGLPDSFGGVGKFFVDRTDPVFRNWA